MFHLPVTYLLFIYSIILKIMSRDAPSQIWKWLGKNKNKIDVTGHEISWDLYQMSVVLVPTVCRPGQTPLIRTDCICSSSDTRQYSIVATVQERPHGGTKQGHRATTVWHWMGHHVVWKSLLDNCPRNLSLSQSFGDRAHVDLIYGCPIF